MSCGFQRSHLRNRAKESTDDKLRLVQTSYVPIVDVNGDQRVNPRNKLVEDNVNCNTMHLFALTQRILHRNLLGYTYVGSNPNVDASTDDEHVALECLGKASTVEERDGDNDNEIVCYDTHTDNIV